MNESGFDSKYEKLTPTEWYTMLVDSDMRDGLWLLENGDDEQRSQALGYLQRAYTYFQNLVAETNTAHMLRG